MGWSLSAVIVVGIIGFFVLMFWEEWNGCLGCGFSILMAIFFFFLIWAGNNASIEESKPVVYTTHLVALSDSANASGDIFLGCGTVGATPTYFYAFNTDKGIVQQTLVKKEYPIYIQEQDSVTLPRLERRLFAIRRYAKNGWWHEFVFNSCGLNFEWQEVYGGTEYYFIVPRGTISTGTQIDTK